MKVQIFFILLAFLVCQGLEGYVTNSVESRYGKEEILSTQQQQTCDWVDLGLPSGILWASCNVGANSPEGYGNYYAWAEITPKDEYIWGTYLYSCNETVIGFKLLTKYCNRYSIGCNGFLDTLTILEPSDDVAAAYWGGESRMPTKEELQELDSICTSFWTTLNGVNGRCFTGPNGNTLFLPAAGYRLGNKLNNAGELGYYWSRSLFAANPDLAWYCFFDSYDYHMGCFDRCFGRTIRAVRSQN